MDIIRGLVKSLLAFLLFDTMAGQLLENTPYEKYARLFTGMLLILIMLSPLISAFKLWDTINFYSDFEFMNRENRVSMLEERMESLDKKKGLENEYKKQVKAGISQWFSMRNAEVEKCSIKIDSESGSIKSVKVSYTGDAGIEKEAVKMLKNALGTENVSVSHIKADEGPAPE